MKSIQMKSNQVKSIQVKNVRWNIKSLKFQLFAGFFTIVLVILSTIGILQSYWLKETQYANMESLLMSRLHNIEKIELIEVKTEEELIEKASIFASSTMDLNVSATIINASGQLIFSSEEALRQEYHRGLLLLDHKARISSLSPPLLEAEQYLTFIKTPGLFERYLITESKEGEEVKGEKYMVLHSKIGPESNFTGILQLSVPLTAVDQAIATQLTTYLMISSMGIVIGCFLLFLFLFLVLKPLKDMSSRLMNIETLGSNESLPDYKHQAEMGQLSAAFKGLLERLKSSFDKEQEAKRQLKAFVSDAAHELRTPITSIRGFAEVLSIGELSDPEKTRRGLSTIIHESDRLSRLVNHLLLLTKLDQGIVAEQSAVDFSEIISELMPQLQLLSGERQIMAHLESDALILANRDQLKQIVLNLFHNACQHTDSVSGIIRLTLDCFEAEGLKQVRFAISDNGLGIPEEALPYIFDRFYRVEGHRSRKTGGEGLGLAIVKSLVLAHQGSIEVQSTLEEGTRFTLFFGGVFPGSANQALETLQNRHSVE